LIVLAGLDAGNEPILQLLKASSLFDKDVCQDVALDDLGEASGPALIRNQILVVCR